MRRNDITGRRFGALLVLKRVESINYKSRWLCQCDCGSETIIYQNNLISNGSKACKKCRIEAIKKGTVRHGMCQSSEYRIWTTIIDRCENPKNKSYPNYGGRGIAICKEWRESFKTFIEDMGKKPKGRIVIDRIDNDQGYNPTNCRWTTDKENANNRRTTIIWNINGQKFTSTADAAIEYNVSMETIKNWCRGKAYKTGSFRQPKEGCSFEYKYLISGKPKVYKLLQSAA